MHLAEFIQDVFTKESSEELAKKQSAYLKSLFPCYGIRKPRVHEIGKQGAQQFPFASKSELAQFLQYFWKQEKRECHYIAMYVLRANKKLVTEDFFPLFEKMVREKSWWDTVDEIAVHIIGPFVAKHPSYLSKMDEWSEDPNFWIRRTALLFQLRFKEKTDEARLFSYIEKMTHEKEFFIRKAIGWALREYAKTNPAAVRGFLQKNEHRLSSLSRKEASRYL